MDYWATFAPTGNPNTLDLPNWQNLPIKQELL